MESPNLEQMRSNFEASLPHRLRRASRVNLQNFIPGHYFAAAASECAAMYIAGYFYGAISTAQAYVEALSKYLVDHHNKGKHNDVKSRWNNLHREKIISKQVLDAALAIFDNRNDFHHLNKEVEQDYLKLEARAENYINLLYTIESEIFAYSFKTAGKVTPKKPEYWPSSAPGSVVVYLRNLL